MSVILFCLLFSINAFATSDDILLNSLISQIANNKPNSIRSLETLYGQTTDTNVALQAAYVLASTPRKKLKIDPSLYAEFSLVNNKYLSDEDKQQLARIAGDGFFQNAKFRKALKWYDYALSLKSLPSSKKEYFLYKKAWCFLNQEKPDKAFLILKEWLKIPSQSPLREPMFIDMGKAYSEAHFLKKQKQILIKNLKFNNKKETRFFLKGLFSSFHQNKDHSKTIINALKPLPFSREAIQELLKSPLIVKKPTCYIMNLISPEDLKLWAGPVFNEKLFKCGKTLLSPQKKNKAALQQVAQYILKSSPLTFQQQMQLAHFFEKSNNRPISCQVYVSATKNITTSTNPKPWRSWLPLASKSCLAKGVQASFLSLLLDNASHWYELKMEKYLLAHSKIPVGYKSLLIDKWIQQFGLNKQNIENLKFIDSKHWSEKYSYPLSQEVLETHMIGEYPLALELIIENSHWTLLSSHLLELEPFIKNHPKEKNILFAIFIDQKKNPELKKVIASLSDRIQSKYFEALNIKKDFVASNHSLIPSFLKGLPISKDLDHLKQSTQLLNQTQHIDFTKEQTILRVEELSQMARKMQTHKWSSQKIMLASRLNVNSTVEVIQKKISQLQMQAEEAAQWKLIAKELEKWKSKL